MTEPIHPRMQLLINAMRLREQDINAIQAAEILGCTEKQALNLVANGRIMSWTHSPLDGEQLRHINHITKEEKWLPRIAADTDPWTVWLDVEDVAWLCCLQFERPLHATDDPPKEAIERRLQYARDMAKMQPPPEPAAQPEAVLIPSPAPYKRQRRDILTPLIEQAVRDCDDGTDQAQVFNLLRQWAKEEPPRQPLSGSTGGNIQWQSATGKQNQLTLDALSKRLKSSAKHG